MTEDSDNCRRDSWLAPAVVVNHGNKETTYKLQRIRVAFHLTVKFIVALYSFCLDLLHCIQSFSKYGIF